MSVNIRRAVFFGYKNVTGSLFSVIYRDLVRQERAGVDPDTTKRLLVSLLAHSKRAVPYYAEIMKKVGDSFEDDPEAYLAKLPILTRERVRTNFEQLKSLDLDRRKWNYDTSGGTTGEPVQLIHDRVFGDWCNAIQEFYSTWMGSEIGDSKVYVWGSVRDILGENWREDVKKWVTDRLLRKTYLNAFQMTPEGSRACIDFLNTRRPTLIIAYVDAMFELARFAQREKIAIRPQSAIITSAGTLSPFMRETIEGVFQCPIFNRYGSREVGDVAGECTAHKGLHVFPWGCYVEIVDDEGKRVPAGQEGKILVTALHNYAMPLIRYEIGDRGVLSAESDCTCGRHGQILEKVSGRNNDMFKMADGTQIDGHYFGIMLYFRPWVLKYQVIQKSHSSILFRIKKTEDGGSPEELADITSKARTLVGKDCQIEFEFVDDIASSASGKYRYILSEVGA